MIEETMRQSAGEILLACPSAPARAIALLLMCLSGTTAADLDSPQRAVALSAAPSLIGAAPGPTGRRFDSDRQSFLLSDFLKTPAQTVFLPDADIYDHFGYSVSVNADGTVLVAGVPLESRRQRQIQPGRGVADGALGSPGNGNDAESGMTDSVVTDNTAGSSGAAVVYVREAGSWSEQAWLKPDSSAAGDTFGFSVSLSADGRTLAAGAPGHGSRGEWAQGQPGSPADDLSHSGAVYVFTRSGAGGWKQAARLNAADAGAGEEFGTLVTLSADGRVLAVGCRKYQENKTIYLFRRNKGHWQQSDIITIRKPRRHDVSASPFAMNNNGSLLAVGVPGENAVQLYKRSASGWQTDKRLSVPAAVAQRVWSLGMSVSLSGSGGRLATVAYEDLWMYKTVVESVDDCSEDCLERDSARQQRLLEFCMENFQRDDCFERDPDPRKTLYSPVLFIYEQTRDGWHLQTRLRLPPAIARIGNFSTSHFDYAVSMSRDGRTVIAGGFGDDIPGSAFVNVEDEGIPVVSGENFRHAENEAMGLHRNLGAAWLTVFKDGTWQEPIRFQAPAPEHDDRFGRSVDIDANGQTIAVGAPRRDTPRGDRPTLISFDDDIHDAGSVFIYSLPNAVE